MTQTHDPGVLERLFGGASATARILDFMFISRDWDYNKTDIAENSNVSRKHVTKAINKLEQSGFIKKTRTVGRSEMYQYNINNKAAIMLKDLGLELAFQECQKIANQELAKQQTTTSQKPNNTIDA